MTATSKKRWVDYLILGLTVFLVFCLLFEKHIHPPTIVLWLGKWHPVVLHFPIVLVIVTVIWHLTGKKVPYLLLAASCVLALTTAITGFLLGLENGTKGELLFWHQWLGVAVAVGLVIWYWLSSSKNNNPIITKGIGLILLVLIGFTGHYGGMITHGEDFLALPNSRRPEKIPANPLIYQHIVGRILDDKCISCHNPNKSKGELLMTNLRHVLKGGESGNTVIPGVPEESELIRRLHLPLEDEEHMPPEGETPLSYSEIEILERWIALGATDSLRLQDLDQNDPLAVLINEMMEPDPIEKWNALTVLADSTLERLSSDYVTITRLANTTNALRVAMYKPPVYDPKTLMDLKPISENIVELDLSGLPIGAEEMALVSGFSNLEWLEIDRTPVTDTDIDTLKTLSKLQLLKIFDTKIGDKSIALLNNWEDLQQLYIWQTNISEEALNLLKEERSDLRISTGIDESLRSEFAALDSIVEPEEK
ncbi:MAG: c-type cytochrome domain-containing protein [Flavobacteriaceae bacterium]